MISPLIPSLCNPSLMDKKALNEAMIDACINDQTDRALALVQRGADVNQAEYKGCTALKIAALRGNLPLVEGLLKQKANVNGFTTYPYATPLELCIATVFIDKEPRPKACSNYFLSSLLDVLNKEHYQLLTFQQLDQPEGHAHYVLKPEQCFERLVILQTLLKNGAFTGLPQDFHPKKNGVDTSLELVRKNCSMIAFHQQLCCFSHGLRFPDYLELAAKLLACEGKVMEALLDYDADPYFIPFTIEGKSIVSMYFEQLYSIKNAALATLYIKEILEKLICRINPNCEDLHRNTPLHVLMENLQPSFESESFFLCCTLLANRGADPTKKNNKNQTPFALLKKSGRSAGFEPKFIDRLQTIFPRADLSTLPRAPLQKLPSKTTPALHSKGEQDSSNKSCYKTIRKVLSKIPGYTFEVAYDTQWQTLNAGNCQTAGQSNSEELQEADCKKQQIFQANGLPGSIKKAVVRSDNQAALKAVADLFNEHNLAVLETKDDGTLMIKDPQRISEHRLYHLVQKKLSTLHSQSFPAPAPESFRPESSGNHPEQSCPREMFACGIQEVPRERAPTHDPYEDYIRRAQKREKEMLASLKYTKESTPFKPFDWIEHAKQLIANDPEKDTKAIDRPPNVHTPASGSSRTKLRKESKPQKVAQSSPKEQDPPPSVPEASSYQLVDAIDIALLYRCELQKKAAEICLKIAAGYPSAARFLKGGKLNHDIQRKIARYALLYHFMNLFELLDQENELAAIPKPIENFVLDLSESSRDLTSKKGAILQGGNQSKQPSAGNIRDLFHLVEDASLLNASKVLHDCFIANVDKKQKPAQLLQQHLPHIRSQCKLYPDDLSSKASALESNPPHMLVDMIDEQAQLLAAPEMKNHSEMRAAGRMGFVIVQRCYGCLAGFGSLLNELNPFIIKLFQKYGEPAAEEIDKKTVCYRYVEINDDELQYFLGHVQAFSNTIKKGMAAGDERALPSSQEKASGVFIPKPIENLVLDLSESSRDLTSKKGAILQYRPLLGRSNPGALARSKSQIFNRFRYSLGEKELLYVKLVWCSLQIMESQLNTAASLSDFEADKQLKNNLLKELEMAASLLRKLPPACFSISSPFSLDPFHLLMHTSLSSLDDKSFYKLCVDLSEIVNRPPA